MSLWLIAHKVRGELAFDVATRIECAVCQGETDPACGECEETGYWWIIPTSGHRAYPFDHKELEWDELSVGEMPEGLPDHYPTVASPSKPKLNLAGLFKSTPIRRRA